MYKIYNILNNKQKRLNENFVKMNSIFQLTLINVVIVEESIDVVWEDRVVNIRKEGVILGILEALLEPVFAEPRWGLDQFPPFIGEVLHRPISQWYEQRSVGIQSWRRCSLRNYFHCHFSPICKSKTQLSVCVCGGFWIKLNKRKFELLRIRIVVGTFRCGQYIGISANKTTLAWVLSHKWHYIFQSNF